jgi:hypothetical protein
VKEPLVVVGVSNLMIHQDAKPMERSATQERRAMIFMPMERRTFLKFFIAFLKFFIVIYLSFLFIQRFKLLQEKEFCCLLFNG